MRRKQLDNSIELELAAMFDVEYHEVFYHINVWDTEKLSIVSMLGFYGKNAQKESLAFWNTWANWLSPDGSFLLENKDIILSK